MAQDGERSILRSNYQLGRANNIHMLVPADQGTGHWRCLPVHLNGLAMFNDLCVCVCVSPSRDSNLESELCNVISVPPGSVPLHPSWW